jgi:D-alanyl-D-alanine carboxypeptidase/D-alanyl-D-alanine-endopeptidase (penicillin-binding protein 4)
MSRRHLLLPLPLVLATITPAVAGDSPEAKVESVLRTPGYQNAHWGLLVVDSETGRVVYEKNADQMFGPASVTKLYSTAVALVDLGAGYRFRTPVVRKGNVDNEGILRGNLILVASGDLSLGGRSGPNDTLLFEDNDHIYANGNNSATLVPANPLAGLEQLAKGIADAGIKRVDGDVLIDDRLFDPAPSTGSGPSRVSAIVVNDNVVDVVVTPGDKTGSRATVRLVPETSFVSFDAVVETVDEGEKPSISVHAVGFRAFSVRGKVPVGHKPVVRIYEVDDPASYARALFIETLRKRGVAVGASPLAHNATERLPTRAEVSALPQVASYVSPPFSEYAKVILKVSHNLYASTQPLLIAAHHGERNLHDGLRRQGRILRDLDVDTSTIAFGGGAGGAREDLVTPRATVALLRALAKRPDYPSFEAALPVLGKDGTLAKAVGPDSPARGHARAKTGTYWVDNALNGQSVITSKALAGTIDTADGRKLTVAFFLNNIPAEGTGIAVSEATAAAGRVLGKLCEVFYESSGDPANAPIGGSPR